MSVPGQAQISNTQYNDITSGLVNLDANRYGVHWIYIEYDGSLHAIYGQGSYKLSAAEGVEAPGSIPIRLSSFAKLAARVIIKKDAPNFTACESAYATLFPVSTPADHNDLGGIQGGAVDDYYHLTAANRTALLNHPPLTTGVHGVGVSTVDSVANRNIAIADHVALPNIHHIPPGDGDLAPKAHKDSHDPIDGSDKLDSAVPVKVGAANAIGSSHSLARADHVHEREHAKYTNAEALAAAKAGAGVLEGDLVQLDAVGLPAVDGSQLTGLPAGYTDEEAQATIKANVEVGDLKAPTKALDMNGENITNAGSITATEFHGKVYYG